MTEKDLAKRLLDMISEVGGTATVEIYINGKKKMEFDENRMDRVKTYDDACSVLGISPNPKIFDGLPEDEIAYIKLKTITKALNGWWKADYQSKDQQKWYPCFYITGTSIITLTFSHAESPLSRSDIGSRLCFRSKELAEYAGRQFIGLYEKFLL